MQDEQLLRYARHILLDDLGIEGQDRLLASKVLVVGAGGLGSPVCLYLASAGVGTITVADADTVDLSNLQRQIMHTNDRVGHLKVDSAQYAMQQINPNVVVNVLPSRLDEDSLVKAMQSVDLVIDCCDNFATRHAINRACVATHKPLVSGAAIGYEGQVCVYDARVQTSPCYHCLFSEMIGAPELNCATTGVFAPLVGIVGSLQAAEAIKMLTAIGDPLVGRLVMFDARHMRWHEVRVPKDPACTVCSHSSQNTLAQQ
jgi:molybdopterin/thiamine biosynthesis adenylyltransferase